jgi:hypothetical protein
MPHCRVIVIRLLALNSPHPQPTLHLPIALQDEHIASNYWSKFRPYLQCKRIMQIGDELAGRQSWCNPEYLMDVTEPRCACILPELVTLKIEPLQPPLAYLLPPQVCPCGRHGSRPFI